MQVPSRRKEEACPRPPAREHPCLRYQKAQCTCHAPGLFACAGMSYSKARKHLTGLSLRGGRTTQSRVSSRAAPVQRHETAMLALFTCAGIFRSFSRSYSCTDPSSAVSLSGRGRVSSSTPVPPISVPSSSGWMRPTMLINSNRSSEGSLIIMVRPATSSSL